MENEAVWVAAIGALGAVAAAVAGRLAKTKAWLWWAVAGAAAGALCAYLMLGRSDGPDQNVAQSKPVRASSFHNQDTAPAFAVDGSTGTAWSAGNMAPQWLEIDLQGDYVLIRLELVVAQSPPGLTRHEIAGFSEDRMEWIELGVIESDTSNGQMLTVNGDAGWPAVSLLRITTAASPSWVAWIEIRAFAAG